MLVATVRTCHVVGNIDRYLPMELNNIFGHFFFLFPTFLAISSPHRILQVVAVQDRLSAISRSVLADKTRQFPFVLYDLLDASIS